MEANLRRPAIGRYKSCSHSYNYRRRSDRRLLLVNVDKPAASPLDDAVVHACLITGRITASEKSTTVLELSAVQ